MRQIVFLGVYPPSTIQRLRQVACPYLTEGQINHRKSSSSARHLAWIDLRSSVLIGLRAVSRIPSGMKVPANAFWHETLFFNCQIYDGPDTRETRRTVLPAMSLAISQSRNNAASDEAY